MARVGTNLLADLRWSAGLARHLARGRTEAHGYAKLRSPSKPVRSGSPRLGRFHSCAGPLQGFRLNQAGLRVALMPVLPLAAIGLAALRNAQLGAEGGQKGARKASMTSAIRTTSPGYGPRARGSV